MARIAGMLGMIGITGADYVHRLFRLSSPIIMLALNACRKRHVRVVKYRGWRECDFVAVVEGNFYKVGMDLRDSALGKTACD